MQTILPWGLIVQHPAKRILHQILTGHLHLSMQLRSRTVRQFTIGHHRHRLVAQIDITDNGPGIPATLRENLFYPMVSGRADGTGLGLSISQSIINQKNGIIEFTSDPGKTTFSIYLPLE